jgi:formylglycine-generating enzyme required for sulfatase activity
MEKSIRLPTEWEWQQAATGGNSSNQYPWGKKWDAARCNSKESRLNRTTSVGIFPQGATLQGVLDMAGNVWEWCLNTYENPQSHESVHLDNSNAQRVVRGGSWTSLSEDLRTSFRCRGGSASQTNTLGFRLAQDIP